MSSPKGTVTYCQTLNAQAISERHWVLVSDVAASFGAQMPASLFYATPAYWTQFHMYADEQPQFTPNATYWLPTTYQRACTTCACKACIYAPEPAGTC